MSKFYFILSKLLKKARGSSINQSKIHRTAKVESGSAVVNSCIDRHSFSGYDCTIINTDIGSFCSIASNVTIGGVSHPIHFVSTSPVFLSHKDSVRAKFAMHDYLPATRTTIGHDVWIGDGAFIKAGITIGSGAVIGMGSVVTRNVEPYSIVAGNPARFLRARFTQSVINSLLSIKWWEFEDDALRDLGPYFNDPEKFIDVVNRS